MNFRGLFQLLQILRLLIINVVFDSKAIVQDILQSVYQLYGVDFLINDAFFLFEF